MTVLDAARTGAEWAWATLYRDLAPAVLGYLRARGATDAEDVTSEVFVAIVKGLPDFEGNEEKFRSWVFVITHRKLLDERRTRGRHPVDPAPTERLDIPDGNVEDEALLGVETQRIHEVLSELTPEQGDVLLMRIVAGLSVEEVARAVGKSAGAVKQLQRRGLATLARALAEQSVVRP